MVEDKMVIISFVKMLDINIPMSRNVKKEQWPTMSERIVKQFCKYCILQSFEVLSLSNSLLMWQLVVDWLFLDLTILFLALNGRMKMNNELQRCGKK